MRLWLGAAFAGVGLITAASVYLFVSDSTERVLSDRSTELAVGRTISLADRIGDAEGDPSDVIAGATGAGFRAWYFDEDGHLVAPQTPNRALDAIRFRRKAVDVALEGGRFSRVMPGREVTVVAVPVLGERRGVVLVRFARDQVLQGAIDRLRSDTRMALLIAVGIGVLAGFGIATAIALRVKRLARSAEEMAAGSFDVELQVSGRDEIGDLTRALDSMRASLKESFGVLTADRDKLTAIFDGLTDAVMVVDKGGHVRFSNSAAARLLGPDGAPPEAMTPQLRRAAEVGFAAHPALRIGDRAYAMQARDLPEENAVLAVVRDRTDEMRREFAERDFISNAAHELRNPLAGISGAIEVLQDGAKEDPVARDHFLERLAEDSERMGRLIQSLLTLARVESLGASEVEVVDVPVAVRDVVAAVDRPPGIELEIDVESDLTATGDPTLLRQVLIGLLSNAYKHTLAPGQVRIAGRRDGDDEVVLEVSDTGSGIPAAEIERVFERFYRRHEARKQEGFGLGLAIARRMVSVMGGRIGATSVEGKGSTFWVRLPLAKPSPTPVA
jgi:two-component system, OmpR family, sensor histidine kinase VicK